MKNDISGNMRGMTINERLLSSGKMSMWEISLREKDRAKLIGILVELELTEKEAAFTVDETLKKISNNWSIAPMLLNAIKPPILGGQTIRERLIADNKMEAWNDACAKNNLKQLINLLTHMKIGSVEAEWMAIEILRNVSQR